MLTVYQHEKQSSFALIQGRTLAGILLDEVVLMPERFVNQALARCSVSGAKFWFNCNPDSPAHWFYTNWIEKRHKKNVLYLHFTMRNNPSLSEETLKRYETIYTGVFYQRYIQGLWVLAEGLVYDFGEDNITDEMPKNGNYYISVDYGTYNPFSAGLWCVFGKKAIRVKEYYFNSRKEGFQKTDEQYCDDMEEFAKPDYNVKMDMK